MSDDVSVFEIGDITLAIPNAELNMPLRKALNSGRFERGELRATQAHLRADDRVLELGAGSGLVTIHCARIVGADRVTSIEPNPAMLAVIEANLARNRVPPVSLRHGAVVADEDPPTVDLYLHGGFWAASLDQRNTRNEGMVTVPAFGLSRLVKEVSPSLIVADLEGAEGDVFEGADLTGVRLVILELHPKRYGGAGVSRVFSALMQAGFAYCATGSQGQVVVFERIPVPG